MSQLASNAAMGATLAIAISLVGRSSYAYLAGLLPLFPSFALYAQLAAFDTGGVESVKSVAAFGLVSLVAYAAYLGCLLWLLANYVSFSIAALGAIVIWGLVAGILIGAWHVFDLKTLIFSA